MSRAGRAFVQRVHVSAWIVGAIAAALWTAGFRYNETASLPIGIWRIHPDTTPTVGTIVNFCPPPTNIIREARTRDYLAGGPCPGDMESMFKPIVAIGGDRVVVTARGVEVNGELVPNSAPVPIDGQGRKLPVAEPQIVPPGFIWLVSSYSPNSFDSRYFGPVAIAAVLGTAAPIFVQGEP